MSGKVADLNTALVHWFSDFAEHGIFTTDDQLIISSWNRWLEAHSGRTAAQLVGQPLLEAWPELVERGFEGHYRGALAGGAFLVSHLLHRSLLPLLSSHGGPGAMPQRARIAPLTAGDTVIGTITVIDDVSERVSSEQELRKQIEAQQTARAAAEVALRTKDDFLATLSHEIRTPLSSVLGWTRILREHSGDPELVARGISIIDRNAGLQLRMIDDLLDTARIVTGKLRLQMAPVDLAAVATAALDMIAPAAEGKGIAIQRSLDCEVGRVLGDADRLQQVLWNLLSNAVKFTPAGGCIEFRLEQAADALRVVLTDTGQGIRAEFLPFVFERFAQAEAAERRESGLGLGLALVKELVTLHGGTISAQSDGEDKGATFIVSLPVLGATDLH